MLGISNILEVSSSLHFYNIKLVPINTLETVVKINLQKSWSAVYMDTALK